MAGRSRSTASGFTSVPTQRPARLDESFGVYTEGAGGRKVTTRLELQDPPADAVRARWPLRTTDIDLHGHLNNAAYWQAVEDGLARGPLDPAQPLRAFLDYRQPIDLGDEVTLLESVEEGTMTLGFATGAGVRAVARIESI